MRQALRLQQTSCAAHDSPAFTRLVKHTFSAKRTTHSLLAHLGELFMRSWWLRVQLCFLLPSDAVENPPPVLFLRGLSLGNVNAKAPLHQRQRKVLSALQIWVAFCNQAWLAPVNGCNVQLELLAGPLEQTDALLEAAADKWWVSSSMDRVDGLRTTRCAGTASHKGRAPTAQLEDNSKR